MKPALLKTLTYGVMHLVVAVAVAFALTRDWRLALAVGLIEPLVQTVAFAIHERAWSRREESARTATACGHAHAWPMRLGARAPAQRAD